MIVEFPFHKPPEGYKYEFIEFKKNIVQIWIWNHQHFNYCDGSPVRSIWGFYNQKKCEFYSPINSKTIGSVIEFYNTTPYSAMKIKDVGIMKFFS